jgi:uncharacterized membrane protein YdbT with pleckstrin-like domain
VAFPRRLLGENEEIALDLHPHWWFLIGPLMALIASIVLGIVLWAVVEEDVLSAAGGVLVLVSLLWFLGRYARWVTTDFVVTSDRLIFRHGVLSKHGIEIPLERVNTVLSSQTLLERIFRVGDLVIESAGEQGRQEFHDVRRPANVQNEIYQQIEARRTRGIEQQIEARRARDTEQPITEVQVAAGAEPSIPSQIRELDELRRRGVLSDEEFARKKQQLLDRM